MKVGCMERINKNLTIKYIPNEEKNTLDEEFSSFQSDVANALLKYIEDKDYAEVMNRLEESNRFLMKLSKEIGSTLLQNNSASGSQNEDFDCAEDILKSGNSYLESSLIH